MFRDVKFPNGSLANRSKMEKFIRERCKPFTKYVGNFNYDSFTAESKSAIHSAFMAEMPDADNYNNARFACVIPANCQAHMVPCYANPLLSPEQERHLFRKLNYLKFLLSVRLDTDNLNGVIYLFNAIQAIQDLLVNSNLRLAVSLAKKNHRNGKDFYEIFANTSFALLRAVNKFNEAKGYRFATFATFVINRELWSKKRSNFVSDEIALENAPSSVPEAETEVSDREETIRTTDEVRRLLKCLNEDELFVITRRHAIGRKKPMTLEKVARLLGDSNISEVRQIEETAILKMRNLATQG